MIILLVLFFLLAYKIEQNLWDFVLVEVNSRNIKGVFQMELLELIRLSNIDQNVRSIFSIVLGIQIGFDFCLGNDRVFWDVQIFDLNLRFRFRVFN